MGAPHFLISLNHTEARILSERTEQDCVGNDRNVQFEGHIEGAVPYSPLFVHYGCGFSVAFDRWLQVVVIVCETVA